MREKLQPWTPMLVGSGLILACVGQWLLQADLSLSLAAGAFLIAVTLFVLPKGERSLLSTPNVLRSSVAISSRQRLLVIGGLLATAALQALATWWLSEVQPGLTWLPFVASIALALVVTSLAGEGLRGFSRLRLGFRQPHWQSPLVAFLFAAITIIALALRLLNLDTIPFGLWHDEALYGLLASRVLEDPSFRPVHLTDVPAGFIYSIAASFAVFGESKEAIRVPAALFGTATVLGFMFLARATIGTVAALAVGLCLAVSRWHLTVSRVGMEVVAAPFFAVVVALCLWNALNTGKVRHYVLLGLSLGLGMWFYPAFWIFAVAVAIFVAWRLLWSSTVPLRQGVIAGTLALILATLPLQLFAIQNPSGLFPDRYRTLSVFYERSPLAGATVALRQVPRYLLMFNMRGESIVPRHNLPGRPMLEFPVAVLAALGVGYSIVRWRDRGVYLLLILWVFVGLLPALFTRHEGDVHAQRSVITLPAMYLLAAVALQRIQESFASSKPPIRRIGHGIILAVPLGAAYLGIDGYFRQQAQDPRVWQSFSTAATLAATWMRSNGPYDEAYITPDLSDPGLWNQPPHPTLRFLAPATRFRLFEALGAPPAPPLNKSVVYFIGPSYAGIYRYLETRYPGDSFETMSPPREKDPIVYVASFKRYERQHTEPRPQFYVRKRFEGMLELVGVDIGADTAAVASLRCSDRLLATTGAGSSLRVRLYWKSLQPMDRDYSISVQLLDKDNRVAAQHDGYPLQGRAPTSRWEPGEYIADPHPVDVALRTPPRCYRLIVAVYDAVTGLRLSTDVADSAVLGMMAVSPSVQTQALASPPAQLSTEDR